MLKYLKKTREKASKTFNPNGMLNIHEYKRNGILIGYNVMRKQEGKTMSKYFTNQKNSAEQNLEFAKQYLHNLKNDIVVDTTEQKLSRGISYKKNKAKQIIGCEVKIHCNGVIYQKSFTDNKYTIEEKIKFAEEFIEKTRKNTANFIPKKIVLPTNITPIILSTTNKISGYNVSIKRNKNHYFKTFSSSKFSVEQNLEMALKYKQELLKTLNTK